MKARTVYKAKNGWTVREIRYATIQGRLIPSVSGYKWFEVFDSAGHNHSSYKAGEQSWESICAIAEAGI